MRLKSLLFGLAAVLSVWSAVGAVMPSTVSATSRDEMAMGSVAQTIDDLWTFVDNSTNMSDAKFYPEFVTRATKAGETVNKAYQELAGTNEKGQAKQAIYAIRSDIGTIDSQLNSWRDAALSEDPDMFQQASDTLADTIEVYNDHVDVYNAAKDGGKSAFAIAGYAAGPAAAFAFCCAMLAWAVLGNQKTDDVAKELRRRLRWHGVISAAAILVGLAVPAVIFFFTDIVVPAWTWWLVLPGLLALLYTAFRYLRVIVLSRRT